MTCRHDPKVSKQQDDGRKSDNIEQKRLLQGQQSAQDERRERRGPPLRPPQNLEVQRYKGVVRSADIGGGVTRCVAAHQFSGRPVWRSQQRSQRGRVSRREVCGRDTMSAERRRSSPKGQQELHEPCVGPAARCEQGSVALVVPRIEVETVRQEQVHCEAQVAMGDGLEQGYRRRLSAVVDLRCHGRDGRLEKARLHLESVGNMASCLVPWFLPLASALVGLRSHADLRAPPMRFSDDDFDGEAVWSGMSSDAEFERAIFCNRELNMKQVTCVGFDLDYTAAQYNVEFDLLAFEGAKQKLVDMGYPAETIETFEFDPNTHRRGLVIDKVRGNILKVDRHKYCRTAYHGFRELTPDERKRVYVGEEESPTYAGDDFVNVDSLFQIIDASLYAQLVEAMETTDSDFMRAKSFQEAYKNVRHAVDLCHHDGVIKDRVAEDPGKYILPDDELVPMLENYRRAGKKVFLLTNSLFDYTNVVMNFLTGSDSADGRDWLDLFDVVVVGAAKPGFLDPAGRADMLRVDARTNRGTLHNLNGAPVYEVGADEFLSREGKIFQGGGCRALHAMLQVDTGSQVLYVGDHMYSDVLRSKRSLGWRTTLIIPELEHELHCDRSLKDMHRRIDSCSLKFEAAELVADDLRLAVLDPDAPDDEVRIHEERLAEAEDRRATAREDLRLAHADLNAHYHEDWGPLFKAGHIASRFAKQVVDYACIYTSRASNLLHVSPLRHFRPHSDSMPHDAPTPY